MACFARSRKFNEVGLATVDFLGLNRLPEHLDTAGSFWPNTCQISGKDTFRYPETIRWLPATLLRPFPAFPRAEKPLPWTDRKSSPRANPFLK